jgi:hypothetical protein
VNPSDSLQLTGLAFIDGKAMATVKDSTTNKTHVVQEEPNELGWKLVSVTPFSEPRLARAKLMIGSEVVEIRYSKTQLEPARKGGYMPSRTPTPEEFTGHDDKGAYVRAVPYLSDEDRTKFRQVSPEARERLLQVVHDQREMLFKASHEDRASFVKKAFDSVVGR